MASPRGWCVTASTIATRPVRSGEIRATVVRAPWKPTSMSWGFPNMSRIEPRTWMDHLVSTSPPSGSPNPPDSRAKNQARADATLVSDRRMAISLGTPEVVELSTVVDALREWQYDGAPMQLHPGDVGWFWRFGAEATAAAVRTVSVWLRTTRIYPGGRASSRSG